MRVSHVRSLPILLLRLHLLGHASWHANNKGMLLMHLHHPWDIGAHCAMCMVRVVSAFDVLCSSQRRSQTQGHGPAQAMAYGHAWHSGRHGKAWARVAHAISPLSDFGRHQRTSMYLPVIPVEVLEAT